MTNERERSGFFGLFILFVVLAFGVAVVLDIGGLGDKVNKLFSIAAPKPAALAPAPGAAPSDPLKLPAAPAVLQAWYLDSSGYEGAEAERKSSGATMLLYFQKHACPACRVVEHELFAAPAMKKFLDGAVKVRIDVTGDRESRLAQQFNVSDLPALIAISASGAHAVPLQRGGVLLTPDKVIASIH